MAQTRSQRKKLYDWLLAEAMGYSHSLVNLLREVCSRLFAMQIFDYLGYAGQLQAQMLSKRFRMMSAHWMHTVKRRRFRSIRCRRYDETFSIPPGFVLLEFPSSELLGSLTVHEKKTMQLRDLDCRNGTAQLAGLTKNLLEFVGDEGVKPNFSIQVEVKRLFSLRGASSYG